MESLRVSNCESVGMESQAFTLALVPGYHPQRQVGYSQTHSVGGTTWRSTRLRVRSEVKVTWSSQTLCDLQGLYSPCDSLGQNAGVGSLSLLQGIFPTQGSIPGLLHCRRPGFDPWVGKIPWRRERLPTPVFWPGEFHGL